MECPEFQSEKLEGRDSAEFRGHRSACEACRRDLEDYDEVRDLYREAAERERYPGAVRRKHRWSPPAWLPLATAAVVLLGLIVTIVGRDDVAASTSSTSPSFVRVPMAAWTADRGIDREFSEAWRLVESLERRN
jgi:hypothetical protein